jgi:hypothetical protein
MAVLYFLEYFPIAYHLGIFLELCLNIFILSFTWFSSINHSICLEECATENNFQQDQSHFYIIYITYFRKSTALARLGAGSRKLY